VLLALVLAIASFERFTVADAAHGAAALLASAGFEAVAV
jgi:hypothetical protein